ncbi:MAG: hypothetical protein QM704_05460 [Anaeromyxobacteraceae bacterium]
MTGKQKVSCQSCGMPIEMGPYCPHCVDDHGNLQRFEDRFERMVQWALRKDPSADRKAAERKTLEYLRSMPAWKDHPRVKA